MPGLKIWFGSSRHCCPSAFAWTNVSRHVRRTSSGSVEFKVPDEPIADTIGAGEGKLNLIAWAGYAEDGSTDPKVDWVTPFEKRHGLPGQRRRPRTPPTRW